MSEDIWYVLVVFGGFAGGLWMMFSSMLSKYDAKEKTQKHQPAPSPKPAPPEPTPPPKPEPKPTPAVSAADAKDEPSLLLKFGLILLKYGIVCVIAVFCTYNIFYDQGFEAGEESGYASGYEKGKTVGYKEGYAEGKDEGYDYGYQRGMSALQDGSFELVSNNSTNVFSTRSIPDQSRTVFVTRTGTKYHNETCYHLSESKIEIDLNSAMAKGYTPCKHCGG